MTRPSYLDLIDTQTDGQRYDVTPLFADGEALAALCADLLAPFDGTFDVVAGIDALGFILGAAMASRAGAGFVAVRKGGKLPLEAPDTRSFVDYTGRQKALELRPDAVGPGTRVLLVDEWIETGAQISAAVSLLESRGAHIAGIAAICIDDNPAIRSLRARIKCVSVGPLDNDTQL